MYGDSEMRKGVPGRHFVLTNVKFNMEATTDIREQVLNSTSITPFQKRVYLELLNVPRGHTITYKELALRIGCRSAQAVGQALRRNPFAPYVPCHRVISSNGSLGGFHGQREGEMIERKRQLLQQERDETHTFTHDIKPTQ